ncbi:triphosphoribosyl-dephospho-CoA synthase [Anoxynatronum buryatiense]|uniref:triphosphoribosyl-dephospho-CoA synthase n=1 Tax=Anoxynatronum buryatiense TaxID=489973 RepID=A0AA46AK92_9CLOT|nr:triphosphoribosyl-dephospho-CoA synthase [Anoxynatronum buryatiense]SMP68557.1 triphosphoribosyl-dephospho-CoA synthase [Anoxynatronum buryatiense]
MDNLTAPINQCEPAEIIGRSLLSGILLEVACHPSPGLVSPFSMGAHEDMNHYSFMLSTAAIAAYIQACTRVGYQEPPGENLLLKLRPLGLQAEKAMLEATGGVNTHKGMIFLGGITAAAAGVAMQKDHESAFENTPYVKATAVCREIKEMCRGLVQRELENAPLPKKETLTQGEYWYRQAGITGVRGEVEAGLPAVRQTGLPVFSEALRLFSLKTAMVHTLLHLMTVVEDTTVLARAGLEGLNLVKSTASEVIGLGGIQTERGQQAMERVSRFFETRRISPGGSADLLAMTIALWIMENGPIPKEKMVPDRHQR